MSRLCEIGWLFRKTQEFITADHQGQIKQALVLEIKN
jgi:hypothetical protein